MNHQVDYYYYPCFPDGKSGEGRHVLRQALALRVRPNWDGAPSFSRSASRAPGGGHGSTEQSWCNWQREENGLNSGLCHNADQGLSGT